MPQISPNTSARPPISRTSVTIRNSSQRSTTMHRRHGNKRRWTASERKDGHKRMKIMDPSTVAQNIPILEDVQAVMSNPDRQDHEEGVPSSHSPSILSTSAEGSGGPSCSSEGGGLNIGRPWWATKYTSKLSPGRTLCRVSHESKC